MAMMDVLMRGMYKWSCASVPKRGTTKAEEYISRAVKNDPKGTKYVAKWDVKKFYPSVKVDNLLKAVSRKVKDKKFVALIESILRKYSELIGSDRGIPIGFYICQWLSNFYLEPLDNFILQQDGVNYYARYADDMVVLGSNKRKLHRVIRKVEAFMKENLDLDLKNNWQVYPLKSRFLDFVGTKQYVTHKAVRKHTFLRFTKQCRKAKKKLDEHKKISYKLASGLVSRAGALKRRDCLYARKKYYDPIGDKFLKGVIRNESKRRLCA